MKLLRLPAPLLGAIAALSLASTASALGSHTYAVSMTGAEEVPPVVTGGTGTAIVTLDDVTGNVTVSGNFTGLTSNATAAHIHGPAAPGANAGILITLSETGGTSGAVTGSGMLSPANVTNMLNGLMYVNIHTSINPTGEIRGQIVTQVPAMAWGWVAGLVVVALAGGALVLMRGRAAVAV